MKKGYLSEYFQAVAAKRLVAVEVDSEISNQHEFNGTSALKAILGTDDSGETKYFPTRFLWFGEEDEIIASEGEMSWYNSRHGKTRAAEWRLFYHTNEVINMAKEGDLLLIAKKTDNSILTIIVQGGSQVEHQLIWLFNVNIQDGRSFVSNQIRDQDDKEINFPVQKILEELGIFDTEETSNQLEELIGNFNGIFPRTADFSRFARSSLKDVNPIDEPDRTLIEWMQQEDKLFRILERKNVENVIREGFVTPYGIDVEKFISYSLSVQNRRKSRAGRALENHLEEIFRIHKLQYSRGVETENRSKPDFLFPSLEIYNNPDVSDSCLTMLGVKTTCKDRWRQILSEAGRVKEKHLFTLEQSISENQTNEMRVHKVQLVVPEPIHDTYNQNQQLALISLSEFIKMALSKQNNLSRR